MALKLTTQATFGPEAAAAVAATDATVAITAEATRATEATIETRPQYLARHSFYIVVSSAGLVEP